MARPRPDKWPQATIAPKQPASGKKRRRMLKAAVWRLARIIHAKPSSLLAMEINATEELVDRKCPPKQGYQACQRGDAMRLVAKIARLRPLKPL